MFRKLGQLQVSNILINLLLVYCRFEYKDNSYKYDLYYTRVSMLLQIGPLLRLG